MIAGLAASDLTNDLIGDDADQAHNRAFSTNAFPALKVMKVCSLYIYSSDYKMRNFGFEKAPGFNDQKWPHITNIGPLLIVKTRELSLCQNSHFITA